MYDSFTRKHVHNTVHQQITVFACPYLIIWRVHANLNPLRALACTRATLTYIKCNRAALACIIQLLRTLNVLACTKCTCTARYQHASFITNLPRHVRACAFNCKLTCELYRRCKIPKVYIPMHVYSNKIRTYVCYSNGYNMGNSALPDIYEDRLAIFKSGLRRTGFFRCGKEWYHFKQELMVSKMMVKLFS